MAESARRPAALREIFSARHSATSLQTNRIILYRMARHRTIQPDHRHGRLYPAFCGVARTCREEWATGDSASLDSPLGPVPRRRGRTYRPTRALAFSTVPWTEIPYFAISAA